MLLYIASSLVCSTHNNNNNNNNKKEQRCRLPVLYDKYSTGGAFDAPTQNTIKYGCHMFVVQQLNSEVNIDQLFVTTYYISLMPTPPIRSGNEM